MTKGESRPQDVFEQPRLEGRRRGLSVLSDPLHATDEAARLFAAGERGEISLHGLRSGEYSVVDPLHGFVVPQWRILHQTPEGEGEFHDWYVGVEYVGGEDPRLLLAPNQVVAIRSPVES